MEINPNIAQYLEIVLNIAFVVLPTLAVLAVTQPLGGFVARGFVSGWQFLRQFFDEKIDPAIVALADATGREPEIVVSLILDNVDGITGILKSELDKLEAQPKAE